MTVEVVWLESWWHEEDITFIWAIDEDRYATRHVERDAAGHYTAAGSLEEWIHERDYGDLHRYGAKWGGIAECRVPEPEDEIVPAPSWVRSIGRGEFERVWTDARAECERRWTESGQAVYDADAQHRPPWNPLKG